LKILYAASENAWGGFLNRVKKRIPEHDFIAEGQFHITDLSGIDILIPTMSQVTEKHLQTADRLKLIQQCGAGLELVDIQAAAERNIYVANVPSDKSGNADSVAELAIYLMIGLSRNVRNMQKSLEIKTMGSPIGGALLGKTVGIIGLGGIGRALAHRLKPFGVNLIGMKQTGHDQAQKELDMEWVGGPETINDLLNQSDYVVLCLPLNNQNKGLINSRTLSMMKQSAYLINVSRGGLVEYDALKEALKTGRIAGAGVDVFWMEPPNPEDDIFTYNVMATPHIGGATDVSMQGIAESVAENITRISEGKKPFHRAE